jgi:hypothetical protein
VTDDRHRPDRDGCGLVRWFLDLIEDAVEVALGQAGKCKHGGATSPVPPGGVAAPVTVRASAVTPLAAAAIGARYTAPGQPPPAQVIWQDGDSEVLVHDPGGLFGFYAARPSSRRARWLVRRLSSGVPVQ